MTESPIKLVQLHMLVPRELKDRVASYVAKHPNEFFSSTEFWIKSAREELDHRAIEDEYI